MSAKYPDFCSGGCGKLITTSHPFNLCPECYVRWREHERTKEHRNRLTAREKSFLVLGFSLAIIICASVGFILFKAVFWLAAVPYIGKLLAFIAILGLIWLGMLLPGVAASIALSVINALDPSMNVSISFLKD